MTGRFDPALHEAIGERGGGEAAAVELVGDVLGDEAVLVALRLGAAGWGAAIGVMVEAVGACEVRREIARRALEHGVGMNRRQPFGMAKAIGSLDDRALDGGKLGSAGAQGREEDEDGEDPVHPGSTPSS